MKNAYTNLYYFKLNKSNHDIQDGSKTMLYALCIIAKSWISPLKV